MRTTVLVIALLQFFPLAWAQNSADYEERIERLEHENEELKQLINEMKSRLDQIEEAKQDTVQPEIDPTQQDPSVPTTIEVPPPDTDAIKEVVQEELDNFEISRWLPSINNETFRFGGRFQMEYYNPESGGPLRSSFAEQPSGTFGLDEARFYIDADFKEKIRFYSSFDVEEGDASLTEAFIAFEDVPFNGELTLGLQDRFYRPSRYTEYYPISGIAFWRSRDLGVILHNDFDPVYTYVSVMNGLNLEEDNFKKDDSDFVLAEDNDDIDLNGEPNVAIGMGLDFELEPWGRFDIMGFAESGKLTDDDTLFLIRELPGYPLSFQKNKHKVGINFEYKIDEWDFFSQMIASQDGELDRLGWYIEGSYKFDIEGWRYLDSIRPLISYSVLDSDIAPNPTANNGSMTWDRRQWTFAVISELTRNVTFRSEYQMNMEDTGGADVNNNELLFQLEVEF